MNTKTKKKILYVITKSNWGGAQRYVYDLATTIDSHVFDITVVLGGSGILKSKLESKNIRTISIQSLGRDVHFIQDLGVFLELLKIFRREKPNIVHLSSSKIGALGAATGRLTGIQTIVFTSHGWAFNEDRNIIARSVIALIHWATVFFSHCTIAVSESLRKQIVVFPLISKKIVTIRNGVSPIQMKSRDESRTLLAQKNSRLQQRLEIVGDKIVWIGTISELHKTKGLHYMIEVMTRIIEAHPRSIFTIIGEGDEQKSLTEIIKRKNLEDNVFLLGFIDQAATYLQAFDIFTLTSTSEAIGYVLLEAGAAGLPVVASRVGGIPEIIEDGKSGLLVEPRNPDEIYSALLTLLKNREISNRLGKNLKHKVEQEFTIEKMVRETTELYLSPLGGKTTT